MSFNEIWDLLIGTLHTTGFPTLTWQHVVMWAIGCFFLYMAIVKDFEPLLLLPIGFGIFLVNFPNTPLFGFEEGGQPQLLQFFYKYGILWEVIPCLIFLGLGAMTDFEPMISNPKMLLIGAGAQLGVFVTFTGTILAGFTIKEAASVGIIGGADGPTTIYLTAKLAPHLLSANTLAAYSYMSMVPIIQAPVMRMMTTPKERLIRMKIGRKCSKTELILFPLICGGIIALMVPMVMPLMGMLLFGNLMRVSGVVKRLTDTAANPMMDIVTIFLGLSVGASMQAHVFLTYKPMLVFALGLLDFVVCTAGGIITVKIINMVSKDKVNPLIGNSGVSAIPMAPRLSQIIGQQYDKKNYLLMHAMAACLAGSIGSPAAAGMLLSMFE
ncbi:MAG: sodium ion-translocating decarboxylase subunit beta [Syntrophobacterales bacterium]|jgi:oxaloacetate decarboxylase beta subunit|nr:sodium ion-translocating decarboxylase subunit beta [Syntrophobacterales bacterium]